MTSLPSPLALPLKFGPNQLMKEKRCLLCKCSLSNNTAIMYCGHLLRSGFISGTILSAFSVLNNFSCNTGSIVIPIFTPKETENRVVVLKHDLTSPF